MVMTPGDGSGGRLAVVPGSFDPPTNGHVDIVLRSARLFDRVVVAVLVNAEKNAMFSATERVDMLREVFNAHVKIEVDSFDGLLVDYARRRDACAIVRGTRTVADFEHEFQMTLMNRHLEPSLETVFMMPTERHTYVSSRLTKEVFRLGGSVQGLVPPAVERWMQAKRETTGPQRHTR
jgi:pantetheine-phosphate adenylyltransferase